MDEVKVFYPEDFKAPKTANTWRIATDEENFIIEFGFRENKNEDAEIKVISSNMVAIKLLKNFIMALISAAIDYEKEFNKDLGMGLKVLYEKKEDEIDIQRDKPNS